VTVSNITARNRQSIELHTKYKGVEFEVDFKNDQTTSTSRIDKPTRVFKSHGLLVPLHKKRSRYRNVLVDKKIVSKI